MDFHANRLHQKKIQIRHRKNNLGSSHNTNNSYFRHWSNNILFYSKIQKQALIRFKIPLILNI